MSDPKPVLSRGEKALFWTIALVVGLPVATFWVAVFWKLSELVAARWK